MVEQILPFKYLDVRLNRLSINIDENPWPKIRNRIFMTHLFHCSDQTGKIMQNFPSKSNMHRLLAEKYKRRLEIG